MTSDDGLFRYRGDVLRDLWRYGVHPTSRTPPKLVRDFVRELYRYEIHRLRARLLGNEFPRTEYAERVDRLRKEYRILSLLPQQFVEESEKVVGPALYPHNAKNEPDSGR